MSVPYTSPQYVYSKPFAIAGTVSQTSIADAGVLVSYDQGWTENYEQDLSLPTAEPISRIQMNGLWLNATNNIAQYQGQGVPEFIEQAQYLPDGSTPTKYPYPIYARVLYAGKIYESQVSNNIATPGTDTSWLLNNGVLISVASQVFIISGVYTPNPLLAYARVTVVAAGGNGGSCVAAVGALSSAGGGGGSGATSIGYFTPATIGISKTCTIGGAGSPSSFGALVVCGFGLNGASSAAAVSGVDFEIGGAGGAVITPAPNGLIMNGNAGGMSAMNGANSLGYSGVGAASYLGGGAVGLQGFNSSSVGIAGQSYGAGGSGGVAAGNGTPRAGGAGAGGAIIIEEFIYG